MPRATPPGPAVGTGTGAAPATGIAAGDRCLYLGIGQLGGKQCDVLSVRRTFTVVRFDTGLAVIALAADCHPVPRRPPPMF